MTVQIKYKKLVKRVLSIILLAGIIGLLYNFINPTGIPLINRFSVIKVNQEKIKIPIFLPADSQPGNFNFHPPQNISLQEVHKYFFNGSAIFINARAKKKYEKGHIPGAISIPVNDIHPDSIDLSDLDPQQKIIVYCDDPDCSLSMELAAIIERKGFNDVYFFTGGWQKWSKAGYQSSKN